MTPRRRDRFFSSLRQLEQRLASESSPIKKTKLAKHTEFADTEPAVSTGLATNSFSKCGLSDSIDNHEAVAVNDFRLADANATSKCGLAHDTDASKCGLAGANATLRCVLADVNATSECGLAHDTAASECGLAGANATLRCVLADVNAASNCGFTDALASWSINANAGLRGINLTSIARANATLRCGLNATSSGSADVTASSNCGSARANSVSKCELRDVKFTSNCGLAGDNASSRCGLAFSGSQWANNHLTQADGLVNLEHSKVHVEFSKAHVELAGVESVKAYPGLAKALQAGPYLESAGVGLTGGSRTQSSTLANIGHLGPDVTYVRDVDHLTYVRDVDHLTYVRDVDHVIMGDVAEGETKDASADAEAMCLRSVTTIGRAFKQDECTMNIIDDLPLNPQKAAMRCSIDDRETQGPWEHEAAGSRDSAEVIHGSQCMCGPPARTIEENDAHETVDIIGGRDGLHEGRTENNGNKYDIVHQGDFVISSGDGAHILNVDYFAHGRESLDSVTLCEDEEYMYDAIFSGKNEDSGSLLELSARWNPWEIGRHSSELDSHPPAEFLSTPMTNNTLDMIDRKTPESSEKSLRHDLQEEQGDGLQDLTHLCALLGLDEHAWLLEVKEASLALQTNKILPSDEDFSALHHEHPGSTFYSNVAKVGENRFQYAEALDVWLQRLLQSQTEPYCCALLLMAKASLQKNKDMAKGMSCKFPSIIQEWLLALQCNGNQQESI